MKEKREGASPPKFRQFLVPSTSSHYSQVLLLLGPGEKHKFCAVQLNRFEVVRLLGSFLLVVVLLCANWRGADLSHLCQFPLAFSFSSSQSVTSLDKTIETIDVTLTDRH